MADGGTGRSDGARGAAGASPGLAALGLFLALGLAYASHVVAGTLFAVKTESRTLEVKGYAERHIDSDWAVWSASFGVQGASLPEAYAELERQRDAVLAFVRESGFADDSVKLSPVTTNTLYRRNQRGHTTHEIEGYGLRLEVEVSSGNVDGVAALARDSSELVRQGIPLSGSPPRYFYTELDDVKVEMLGDATADARRRAETLARNSQSEIGGLRHARQGVFQITPAHSTEVSNYGTYDTSTRAKAIKAVVTIRYAIGP